MPQKHPRATVRPEIARAWRRAELAGLDPGMLVRETPMAADLNRGSRLMIAVRPVLDAMMGELAGTRFAVLLADRDARIVERRVGQRGLYRALDRACVVPGQQYLEETTGTNSLATAYELRQPISVTGAEHFLDQFKMLCCHGAPILHPVTRRLEGVLDISGSAAEATPLLGPFLMRAVRDIEQRLLAGARLAEQCLLAEFQAHTRRKHHAIVALGESIVLGNAAAMDLLASSDHATLRTVAAEIDAATSIQRSVVLASGATALVRARPVVGCPGGVLFDVVEMPTRTDAIQGRARHRSSVILVVGEPGTGRTTEGRNLAGPDAVEFTGEPEELTTAVDQRRPVLVDDIHLVSPRTAAHIAAILRNATGRVILTSSPVHELSCEQAGLCALAVERIELPPLRTLRSELAGYAAGILRRCYPDRNVRLTASAVTALAAHNWPGNVRELESVLAHAVGHRSCGDITDRDLPSAYRNIATRTLSPIETAERDTILFALKNANGNKAATANTLGIGRTTLYDRLRRYHITT